MAGPRSVPQGSSIPARGAGCPAPIGAPLPPPFFHHFGAVVPATGGRAARGAVPRGGGDCVCLRRAALRDGRRGWSAAAPRGSPCGSAAGRLCRGSSPLAPSGAGEGRGSRSSDARPFSAWRSGATDGTCLPASPGCSEARQDCPRCLPIAGGGCHLCSVNLQAERGDCGSWEML